MQRIKLAKEKIRPYTDKIGPIALFNQEKVLLAFQKARVGTHCFGDSTGYGYDDIGRQSMEEIYAQVFQTESALVRPQIVSGTHAITLCLSLLEPGDELVSLSGAPYDTLQQVIGTSGDSRRSLIKRGIKYREIELIDHGKVDLATIGKEITSTTTMVMIQRSRGYSWRRSLSVSQIGEAFALIKQINPNCICFVDNCYGEFVETMEPTEVGANLMAGSLIKNPGGTLAPSGGYVVGDSSLVGLCGEGLTAPGLGSKVGPTFGLTRLLLHGFFLAPHIVGEALHGAILAAQVFSDAGFPVSPLPNEPRTDIIQAIQWGTAENLLAMCRGIQMSSPVDSQFMPIPDDMPGYEDKIVMAGGTFIQGSSLELSADAPLREPYIGYWQGGMSREHVEIALERVISEIPGITLDYP